MATHVETVTTFIDDITGEASEDVKQYTFGLDDTWYEIDLSDATAKKHFTKFVEAVQPHARKAEVQDRSTKRRGRPAGTSKSTSTRSAAEYADVREWAAQNGFELSPKGRIPKKVWDAYDAAPPAEDAAASAEG